SELKLSEGETDVTFHDPCRLGRHLGIYEEPRKVLSDESNHFREMKNNGKRSLCCGVSAWMNCDVTAKAIQKERLHQAEETGADVLGIACPKCQIHLICTMQDPIDTHNRDMKIKDISSIALERLDISFENKK
ncbi:MAG: heterodisulfide reductase-related iron-sulfur binding cluster, partial [Fidelibacterota bacterium]